MVCLIIDMSINKLKIKFENIKLFIVFTIFYILISLLPNPPIYFENLNWKCSKNYSYIYDLVTKRIDYNLYPNTCLNWRNNSTAYSKSKNCTEIFKTYYCPTNVTADT